MTKNTLHFSLFLFCLIIFGCAQSPPAQVSLNSSAHQLSLQAHSTWKIQGKLGFKSPDKTQSASFNWRQQHDQYQLNLTSIIGTSILKMSGDKEQVSLQYDDNTYEDTDPSFLIWRITGWQIPVEHFPMWVKGQHQPDAKVLTSPQGWINQLQPSCVNCGDWLINYDNYKKINQIWLPHKIILHNKENNSKLIIRVNSWS